MHFTKASVLITQATLATASVLGAPADSFSEMGRRQDWRALQDQVQKMTDSVSSRFAPSPDSWQASQDRVLTQAKNAGAGWRSQSGRSDVPFSGNNNNNGNHQARSFEDVKAAGLKQADAAVAAPHKQADAFRAKFGNRGDNNGDNIQPRDFDDDRAAGLAQADAFRAKFGTNNKRNMMPNGDNAGPAAPYMTMTTPSMPAPPAPPAPTPWNSAEWGPNSQGQKGWQDDVASAHSLASSWQTYGSSVAASANANGDWQGAVESAHRVASSYRSEYAPVPTTTGWAQPTNPGSVGTVGGAGVVQPTGKVVEVNAADRNGVSAAKMLGAGAVAVALVAGML